MSKVPAGWREKRLGQVAELQRGFDLPSRERKNGTIPIISSGGVSGFHDEYKVQAPGIVTGRYGSIGDVFFVTENFWPLNTALWVKDFHGNEPKFIYYLLSAVDYTKYSDKTGVPGVNRNDLHVIKTLVPPLPEQRKIAKILSTWDKAIAATEALIAASEEQKRGLMQELLTGKRRFGGFEGAWRRVRLGDVASLKSGGTPPSSVKEYYDGDVLWASIADMTKAGKYINKTERTITELGLNNSAVKVFPKNTVLYAMYASIGKCSIATVEMGSSQAILGIQPDDGLMCEFLYYVLLRLEDVIKLQGQQGTQSNLNASMVKSIRLLLPSLPEQEKIAEVLSAADREIELLREKLAYLQEEKKGLMQVLLTGKRRVVVDEEEAVSV